MPNTLRLHRLHCLHCLHRVHRVRLVTCWALFAALPLGACGGGGGTPPTYTIGGTVSGIDDEQSRKPLENRSPSSCTPKCF
jgi:hypothetical protein